MSTPRPARITLIVAGHDVVRAGIGPYKLGPPWAPSRSRRTFKPTATRSI